MNFDGHRWSNLRLLCWAAANGCVNCGYIGWVGAYIPGLTGPEDTCIIGAENSFIIGADGFGLLTAYSYGGGLSKISNLINLQS